MKTAILHTHEAVYSLKSGYRIPYMAFRIQNGKVAYILDATYRQTE